MCDFDDYMLSVRLHGLLAAKKTAGRTARVPVAIVYVFSSDFPIYHFFDPVGHTRGGFAFGTVISHDSGTNYYFTAYCIYRPLWPSQLGCHGSPM